MVDLEKLAALVHTFPYPTTELAICVEHAIAELRAARALIAAVGRVIEEGRYYEGASCTACLAFCGEVERDYSENDERPRVTPVGMKHAPDCAWVAYDAATSRATLGKSPP